MPRLPTRAAGGPRGFPALAFAIVATLLAFVPTAAAHGAEQAAETEIHLIEDEADDSFYATGGFDIYQIFLGEAYFPELGEAEAGDGLYFRGTFYGTPDGSREYKIVITFQSAAGEVVRSFATKDGKSFAHDFDRFDYESGAEELEVSRAVVLLASAGLAKGDTLSGFKVESFVDGDIRDSAPGTIYVPNSGVPLPVYPPMYDGRGVINGEATLAGPSKYATASAVESPDDPSVVLVTIVSSLKMGEQHARAGVVGASWIATPLEGDGSAVLKPNATLVVPLRITPSVAPGSAVEPGRLDVTTDLGGRVSFVVAWTGASIVILPEGSEPPIGLLADTPLEVPAAPAIVASLAVASAALALARRRA